MFHIAIRTLYEFGEITNKYRTFLLDLYSIAAQYYRDNIGDEIFKTEYKEICLENNYYLCCFSTNRDALSLWIYYIKSKAYEGFSIGFDANRIEKAVYRGDTYNISICSVIYEHFYDMCVELIKKYKGAFRSSDDSGKAMLSYLFCCFLEKYRLVVKNNCFFHEQEVRAILNIKTKSQIIERFDWSKGFPRPYVEIDFEKSAFRDIVIGPLVEKEISKKMTERFLESRSYPYNNRVRNSKAPIRF